MQLSLKTLKTFIFEAQRDVKPLSKINQRAQNKGKEALFSDETLGLIANLPETELSRLENRKGFIKWLANVVEGASRSPSTQDIRYIVDFVVGSADARIETYKTFDDAYKASQEWHETLSQGMDQDVEHRDDAQVIHDFKNGYKIVDLQQCDLDAEGNAMGHCVGTYDLSQGKKIYSLRDARNKPHVTIEIENNEVEQIKGKQNEPPVEKYAKMIRAWLKTTSFDYMSSEDYISIATPEELILFAESDDPGIRMTVAESENTPENILRILAKDESDYIRASVARNKNTPQDVLRALVKDKGYYVRSYVARNEYAPEDILRALSKDDNEFVRASAAYNKNTPEDILRILAKDENYYVRKHAAENEITPQDILRALSKDENKFVRAAVAANKSIPQDILRILAKDPDGNVRAGVGRNENTHKNLLKVLANDEARSVRRAAGYQLMKIMHEKL